MGTWMETTNEAGVRMGGSEPWAIDGSGNPIPFNQFQWAVDGQVFRDQERRHEPKEDQPWSGYNL